MSAEFDRKARCVGRAWATLDDNDEWRPIVQKYNLGFPYAYLHDSGDGTLSESGKAQVEETYDFLVDALNLPPSDYYDFIQMLDAVNKEN